jgi:hypothetical protein
MYPRSFPRGTPKVHFFWIQLDVEPPKVVEGFFQTGDEIATLSRLYHDVIDVNLEAIPYFLFKAKLHAPLICSPRVFQSERHFYVAKAAKRSDKHGGGLVHLDKGYLVIARVGIQKTQELTSGHEIYDLVYAWKSKRIFQTCLFQAHVVNTHPPFLILFLHKNRVGYPLWVLDFHDETSG